MYVVLFDIDGTLLHTGGAGGVSLLGAFRSVFDIPEPGRVPFAGRTDRWIVSRLFQLHGIEDTEPHWRAVRDEYLRQLVRELPKHSGRVLPGVEWLLERLAARDDVALGLLTGNTQRGAHLKLAHYQLDHHFGFGGFGDRQRDRTDVAAEALAAARRHVGREVANQRVWVVGDTPLDVQCARAVGVGAVAVAIGWHDREALAASAPDLLLDSLEHPDALLVKLNGSH